MARTAEVKRDARIGEAEARADSQIKEAIAEEERLAARLVNDIEIAKAQRDFELKKAAYDQEVQAKVSISEPQIICNSVRRSGFVLFFTFWELFSGNSFVTCLFLEVIIWECYVCPLHPCITLSSLKSRVLLVIFLLPGNYFLPLAVIFQRRIMAEVVKEPRSKRERLLDTLDSLGCRCWTFFNSSAPHVFVDTWNLNSIWFFSLLGYWQKAEAELAYELQAAKTKQRLREEEMQIQVVERTQQILVQEQEIMRKEKELDAKVRRPAEAEKFK